MLGVEDAATSVTGDAEARWTTLRSRLGELQDAFDRHIAATERPGGFLDEVVGVAPHLANRRRHLTDEHREIAARLAATLERDDASIAAGDVADLLAAIEHHRHRGAEFIYDAYSVDIGPSD